MESKRFKLYKSGKMWVVGLATAAVFMVGGAVSQPVFAADTPSVQQGSVPAKGTESIVNLTTVEDYGKWSDPNKVTGTDKEGPVGYRPGDKANPTPEIAGADSTATHNGKVDNFQAKNPTDGVVTTNRVNHVQDNGDYTVTVNGRTIGYRNMDKVDDGIDVDRPEFYGVNGQADATKAKEMIASHTDEGQLAEDLQKTFPQYNFSGLRFEQKVIDQGIKYYIDPNLDDTMYEGIQIAIARINALGIVNLVETDQLDGSQIYYTNPYTKNGEGGYWFGATGAFSWPNHHTATIMVVQCDSNIMENGYGIDADDIDKAAGVMLHETGHALGFGHSDMAQTVMNGDARNTVETGIDALFISGLATLYGKPEQSVEAVNARDNENKVDTKKEAADGTRQAILDAHNGTKTDLSDKSQAYKDAYTKSFEAAKNLGDKIESGRQEGLNNAEDAAKNAAIRLRTQAVTDALGGRDMASSDANYVAAYNAATKLVEALKAGHEAGQKTPEDLAPIRTAAMRDAIKGAKADTSSMSATAKAEYEKVFAAATKLIASLTVDEKAPEVDDLTEARRMGIIDAIAGSMQDVSGKSEGYQEAYKSSFDALRKLIAVSDAAKEQAEKEQAEKDQAAKEEAAKQQAIKDDKAGRKDGAIDAVTKNQTDLSDKSEAYKKGYQEALKAMNELVAKLQAGSQAGKDAATKKDLQEARKDALIDAVHGKVQDVTKHSEVYQAEYKKVFEAATKLVDSLTVKPIEKPEEKPTDKPEVDPEEKPEEKPEVDPEEKPTDKPEVDPEEKPEEKPEVDPEEKPTDKPEVDPEVKPEEKPEEKPVVDPEVKPEVTPEVTPEDVLPEVTPVVDPEVSVQPELPAVSEVQSSAKTLPQTGNESNNVLVVFGVLMTVFAGALGLKTKKN